MLRQIFRRCKPQNVELWIKNKYPSGFNALNMVRGTFYPLNLKTFHTSNLKNMFIDYENAYAYNILLKIPINKPVLKTAESEVESIEEFNKILDQNWRDSSIEEVVNTFLKIKNICVSNDIKLSDHRFDKLVDGLVDNCEHITDEELISLLYCLVEFPIEESYTSHNFHDIWSCLDDICCWKMVDWDIDKCFVVANTWYHWHLGKFSDYIYILIDRLVKKAESLTKEQLINIFFYLNVCRKRPVDFEFEYALEKLINTMDIDEMGVVAMGYFKTKTKIKLVTIQEAIVNKVIESSKTVHEISLTAILKSLRHSKPLKLQSQIDEMTEKLCPEIDRLSDVACTHLALMSTGIQTYNKNVFKKVSEKLIKKISNVNMVRIKDIERMLNVLTMFDYDPKTEPDFFQACLEELHKRQDEVKNYPRCLICAMNYLSLRNIYSHELLNKILDMEFIDSTFGKTARSIPRELFALDCSIDIECTDYKGNRLPPTRKYKTVKWLCEYTPTHDQWKKLTAADKLVLDTIDCVKSIVGAEKLMFINHVLPHFSRADIILCKNKNTNKFVEPKGFENYILGDIMFPFNDDSLEWFAIVVLGWNNTIKNTVFPLGHSVMKERQLKKIGYKPILIFWKEFASLSDYNKKEYILNKLS